MSKSGLNSWFLAIRPKTLTTALIPILVGTALSYAIHGQARPELSLLALVCSLLIQVGTNLINDALDFKKGADTEERLGPQRVTQSGVLEYKTVWWGGIFCFLAALVLAIPLVIAGGWPIIAIGIFSLICGYAYTGGPFPLAYLGLGDLFVLIFFGWIAVSGVYYLNSGSMDLNAWVAGTQVGLLATVLIAINNFRDLSTDRKANKRTLAVRLGPTFARCQISALSVVPFFIGFFWYQNGMIWASVLPLFVFPVALQLVQNVNLNEPGVIYNQFLARGAVLHLGFGILLGLGLLLR